MARLRVQVNVQSRFVRLENASFDRTVTNDELGNWDVLRAFFFTLEMGVCRIKIDIYGYSRAVLTV